MATMKTKDDMYENDNDDDDMDGKKDRNNMLRGKRQAPLSQGQISE